MRRREFIALATGATAWPLTARAQREGMRLVGVLMGFAESDPTAQSMVGRSVMRFQSWVGRKAAT